MNSSTALKPKLLAISVAACFAVSAQAGPVLPTGATGVVGVTGTPTIAGSTLTVNTTGNSVLNYTSFSIGAGATVQINQQSSAFASLQRVIGAGGVIPQSVIDGVLSSNGRVFLLNRSGVVIGKGARIDVAGFVASSLNMSDEDFLKGRLRFTENPGAKAVQNFGEITTTKGGHVYLIAPEVENHGIIRAPQGQILLAAGKSAELVSDASPYVTVKVVADTEKALNVGQLIADSGSIGIFGALVQHSGVAEASGAVVGAGGQIRFIATKDLTIDAGSRIAANGTSGGKIVLQAEGGTNLIGGTVEATGSSGKGGEIQALGVRVGVVGHGIIDASGEAGGGSVMVGGDYQGKNSAIQNAERTYIGADGVIRADAGANGDGGRVIVWADGDTRFYGSISAQGGSQSGNGGFVETSGKGTLQAFGRVNVSASHGKNGNWLLDPTDLEVVSGDGADDVYVTTFSPGIFDTSFEGPTPTSRVGSNAIEGYGGDVTLHATNDLTFSTNINKTNGGLIALADNSIHLKSSVITTSGGQTFVARDGAIDSDMPVSQLVSTGGSVTLTAGTSLATGGITAAFFVDANAGTALSIGAISAGSSVNVFAGTALSTGAISAGDSVNANAGTTLTTAEITATSVDATAGTTLTTGAITTTTNFDTHVTLLSYGGNVTVGGGISTGLADEGSSTVSITAQTGAVNVGGAITTGAATCCGETNVDISGSTGISTMGIKTGTNSSNVAGDIRMQTGGQIMVNGDLDASGAAGTINQFYGATGGNVDLFASAVTVTGMIKVGGGNAYGEPASSFFTGGRAGNVGIFGNVDFMPVSGGVNIGGIDAQGGMGPLAAAFGGAAGNGGDVNVRALGAVSIGSINVSGGAGGGNGINGASGGTINVSGDTSLAINFAVAAGGSGAGYGGSIGVGGSGGSGGTIQLSSLGTVLVGSLDASGGAGGAAPNSVGGAGGDGGSIFVTGGTVTVGSVSSRGGAGGDGATGGDGGWGGGWSNGVVSLFGSSFTAVGILDLSGGNAGSSTVSGGGSGGTGGLFQIGIDGVATSNVINVGFIKARGGAGSTSPSSNPGGRGGDGGEGFISAITSITIGSTPKTGQSPTVVDLSGGAGGGSAGGVGGDGGWGGFLTLDPISMTINGVLAAMGGAGGAGATPGVGGNGGEIFFATTGGTGIINFVNGGWDLTAGAGGINGFIFGPGTIPAQLDVAKFVFVGPGDMADIPVTDVGIFRFTALADVLSNPVLLQSVGVTQFEAQKTAESSGDGSTGEKEEKGKEKTGSLGSCRPS